MRPAVRIAVGALVLALMAIFCARRLEVTNEVTHFLAPGDDPRLADLSRRLAASELTRTVILDVAALDTGSAIAAADGLVKRLADHPEVAWIHAGWDSDRNADVHQLYFPRRLLMLSDRPEQDIPALCRPESLRERARGLVRQLSLPTAPLVKRIAPADPLLAFPALLARLEAARDGSLSLVDDHFVTSDGHALVFLASRRSPFESEHQRPLQRAVEAASAEVAAESPGLRIEQSGVGAFALHAEDGITRDITRISTLATLGIVLLFAFMFRSMRLVVLPLLPIVFGVLAAATVTLLWFGRIHGLTLAFGSSLVGVAIDYPVHLFTHHVVDPHPAGPAGTLRRIRPGLLLGAGTTIAGFAGLGWTSFPGVREIALFASVGIASALLATLLLLPALLPRRTEAPAWARTTAGALARALDRWARRPALTALLPAAALAACALAWPRVRFDDDISSLARPDPELLAEDERVRAKVSRMDAGRLVLAIGPDEETALQRNDEVALRMETVRDAGAVEAFRSAHTFLWSRSLQEANRSALAACPTLFEDLCAAYEAEGLRAGAFAPFRAALDEPVVPLEWKELHESPLRDLVVAFRTELEGEVGFLTFVRGVSDPAAIEAAVADLDGVYWFDQKRTMAEIYGRHRMQTLQLLVAGVMGVMALLLVRHRRLRPALAAFAPAALAAAAAAATIVLLGTPLHLLHVVSLLLVLSMGVDYGVFLVETDDDPTARGATMIGLVVACLSTVFAFGLLGMSDNPALEAIGHTTGLGVIYALVLAPAASLLLQRGGTP
jgi:predicted exporter